MTKIFTADEVKEQATQINLTNGTNIMVFAEDDFNNYAYIEASGKEIRLAQGSLSVISRALKTFELGLTIGISLQAAHNRVSATPAQNLHLTN